jgi:hypothetical protein
MAEDASRLWFIIRFDGVGAAKLGEEEPRRARGRKLTGDAASMDPIQLFLTIAKRRSAARRDSTNLRSFPVGEDEIS